MLPAPLHFTESFLKLTFPESPREAGGRAGHAGDPARARRRDDLDRITMLDWLRREAPARARHRALLAPGAGERDQRRAGPHGRRARLQVFRLGFLARADAYEMGVPAVPLGELYGSDAWKRIGNVETALARAGGSRIVIEGGAVRGVGSRRAGTTRPTYYVCALPFERVDAVAPELAIDVSAFEHSPITGIHLWFDRPVTDLPHATLLDRTIQWMFNKSEGRYMQLVVSASRSLVEMPRAEVIALALRELAEFFPRVREAKLEKAHVVKEIRATFSARPGLEARRPAKPHHVRQPVPGRRLDPLRLARHHGRRGAQRISRGRGGRTGPRERRDAL